MVSKDFEEVAFKHLDYLEGAVKEVSDIYEKNSKFDRDSVAYPIDLIEQLEYISQEIDKSLNAKFSEKLSELKNKFKKLQESMGQDFLDEAFREFVLLSKYYSNEVDEMIIKNFREDLWPHYDDVIIQRDNLEVLSKFLNGKRNISQMLREIEVADAKFKDNIKGFSKHYDVYDDEYYPKSFWWRHLKKIK
ncbi:MAG: hypothetical protein ABIH20_04445 [Candidatus Diapherotrites archaeon]